MTVAAQDTPSSSLSQPLFSLTIGEFLGILLGGGALLVGLGKILWDAARHGGTNVDAALTRRVQDSQADRDWMFKIERAYDLSNERTHKTLEAVVGMLSNIAPLTKFQVDDALLALLKDIQKPGAPVVTPPTPVEEFPSAG